MKVIVKNSNITKIYYIFGHVPANINLFKVSRIRMLKNIHEKKIIARVCFAFYDQFFSYWDLSIVLPYYEIFLTVTVLEGKLEKQLSFSKLEA